MAKKGFSSPAQYGGDNVRTALIRNWRALTTHINKWLVAYETDGISVAIAGDLTVTGDIAQATVPDVSGARDNPEAALADLLTELAGIGLITDSTTAS